MVAEGQNIKNILKGFFNYSFLKHLSIHMVYHYTHTIIIVADGRGDRQEREYKKIDHRK
jgi:hypothetical protein